MKWIILSIMAITLGQPITLFDFNNKDGLNNWRVVDDVVMGGKSDGNIKLSEEGHAIFYGKVSLENNGGFSSIRGIRNVNNIADYTTLKIRLKGDGKRYQVRVKSSKYDYHSYIYYFETTGEWQDIEVNLSDMKPSYRGYYLDIPNFPGEKISEMAFLISNKKAEEFRLEIDNIQLI